MIQSTTIGKLVAALTAAQKAFLPILKEKENPGFKKDGKPSKYADLAGAIEATQPALIANGLVVIQFPINEADRVGCFTMLAHESGEFQGKGFTLPLASQSAQVGVAAVTYSRRAGYLAAIGAAAEDDDGNTAAGNTAGNTQGQPANSTSVTAPARPTNPPPVRQAPPKAEIPQSNSDVTAATQTATTTPFAANSDLSEEDRQPFYKRLSDLSEELGKAGLAASRGLPIKRKVLNYLFATTGTNAVESISRVKWNSFFDVISLIRQADQNLNGIIKVIGEVEANKIKTQTEEKTA